VILRLLPALKGKGLVVEKECAKILALAGIQDVWSKTLGQTKTKFNLIKACEEALRNLSKMKLSDAYKEQLLVVEGGRAKAAAKKQEKEDDKAFLEETVKNNE